jgi:ATP-dependent helicase/nuclease subunit A
MSDAIGRGPSQPSLFGGSNDEPSITPAGFAELHADDPDSSARQFAVDPRNNVVLEASAGTGKTSVLVSRYVNLLKAGVDPSNILAITFTRKAAAEMRERIVRELRESAARSQFDRARWNDIRERLADVAISTIDAFCLSLLREFPLEADLDPGFEMADETEVPRLVDESLDQSLRIFARLAKTDPDVALVLAQLGVGRTREGLATLLDRRLVAWDALDRFLARGPSHLTAETVCAHAVDALRDVLATVPGGLPQFISEGPVNHPRYQLLARDLLRLDELHGADDALVRGVLNRVEAHFITADGNARRAGGIPPYRSDRDYPSEASSKRHRAAVYQMAPAIQQVIERFARDLNVVLARGVRRMFAIALEQYRRALDARSLLDFSDVLQHAIALLRRMDEFSQSRFRLESRYHHVLVDEFQDTSRAQWELVSLLIQSWREGLGLAANPSIFIVGDRKQSIYRFRDAEVAVLNDAARYIEALRPAGEPRRTITRSFRARPELLAFVNEVFSEMSQAGRRPDEFTYTERDRFPLDIAAETARGPVLGVAVGADPESTANTVAAEIQRILDEETVRDRQTGVPRQARPGDIAILFRSRATHREFEQALEHRDIPAYVYKGLGFFDADEIKDASALLRYLADPESNLRAAALLRSRFVRLSDAGLSILGSNLAAAILDPSLPRSWSALDAADRRVLALLRRHAHGWIDQVDRVPPADLIEELLSATAYAFELRGARREQAWENLKKMRALVRRIQNRGYATLSRIADHIDSLTAGDECNAVIEALDAVNLMTVHASKGLEFPIVFVVNVAKGATAPPRPVRIVVDGDAGEPSVSIGPFVSDSDEAERERDKHETRRLLYVALTRARDRLYLSSVLKDGALQLGRGSLAEVLPDSLKTLFARAATAFPEVGMIGWESRSGRVFDWRICRGAAADASRTAANTHGVVASRPLELLNRIELSNVTRRTTVTEWLEATASFDPPTAGDSQDSLTGILVHRLIQAGATLEALDAAELAARASALVSPEERAPVRDFDRIVATAVASWKTLHARSDVAALVSGGECLHEVPFSLQRMSGDTSVIVRGTIDCLVRRADGSVAILEFKTGKQRAWHQEQLALYVAAARTLFPTARVEGHVIYVAS